MAIPRMTVVDTVTGVSLTIKDGDERVSVEINNAPVDLTDSEYSKLLKCAAKMHEVLELVKGRSGTP
jgi:hypothetical protein